MKKLELIKGVFAAKEQVEYAAGSIVSRELIHNTAGSLTLFSFAEGQAMSEHTAPFDAVVQVLDGQAEIHVGGEPHVVKEGQTLIMPANVPHALYAALPFKMMLIMIKG